MTTTDPEQAATTRARHYADAAVRAATPDTRAELLSSRIWQPEDSDQAFLSQRYRLTAAPPIFDRLAAHWTDQGYTIRADRRTGRMPYLSVENPTDGYRMSLERNVPGDLLLCVSSPLFHPSAPQ